MSYHKKQNTKEIWQSYCSENIALLNSIGLHPQIYSSEKDFREYLTYGTIDGSSEGLPNLLDLDNNNFSKLFKFITAYFDMDACLFDRLEQRRLRK